MDGHAPGHGLKASWPWLEFASGLAGKPVPYSNLAAGNLVFSGRCLFLGITGANAATVAGSVVVYDGQDATGPQALNLAAAASSPFGGNGPNNGILCEIGVFVRPVGITISGSVIVVPLWHYGFTPPGE